MDGIARYVTIYGRQIKVAIFDRLVDGNCGRSHYVDGAIELAAGEPHHEARTLIHEMVHLMMVDNGMKYQLADKDIETFCDLVQHFITQAYEPNRETIMEIAAGRPLSKESRKRGKK